MQLTIRATGPNVKVISFLLAKNPSNLYERSVNGHLVRMFYHKFTEEEVGVTFFVTPDPIELSRNNSEIYDITSYINDREFVVSSIFCSFLRSALSTALNGKPKAEYDSWVNHCFPLEFSFGPLASHLSDKDIVELFEPLGFKVDITYGDVDYSMNFKTKSTARYITIKGSTTLQMGLRQLFVLIPVLDNYKHYFIDEKEVEKIERYGAGWLDTHPKREFILQQALRFKDIYSLVEKQSNNAISSEKDHKRDQKVRLNDLRYEKMIQIINQLQFKESIVDFGSGEGKLAVKLGFVNGVKEILAVEPSESASIKALKRFEKVEQKENFIMPEQIVGSLFYYDERLINKDIMILCEVIEHIDEYRLPKIMKTILQDYRPKVLLITTPNQEYNKVYGMGEGYRHPDHRFEWTREEFYKWCEMQNEECEYDITFAGIGEEHDLYGYPTQMCLFMRKEL
ncbi:3' terminal RNA ribose 2'-O-methyltransferase Hen1 [Bacillus sp. WMMC1349]|uniref:methyltransferase domain-containing protein n=1 Tax=Bacillus sp. WMMC1349 TaxID=2736254 RepID=UPI001554AD55|nr:methyltransferase domain-containing protein [Bacillus sp. WMMC1349]NPC94074.1 3' terminal RNA ribose 2'-O-methyltransferase Hen1 [Bacillus sp. WMMC1349]